MAMTKEELEHERNHFHRLSMIVGIGYIVLSAFSLYLTFKTVKLESENVDELE